MPVVLALVMVFLVPVCALADETSWEVTRVQYVDPLNSLLHRHLPDLLSKRDLDGLMRMYDTEEGTGIGWSEPERSGRPGDERLVRWSTAGPPEEIRGRYARILALFPRIDRAELRIDRIDWSDDDPQGHPATVRLIVRGMGPGGDRRQLEQHAVLRVRFFDPFWEITAEEVTSRTLLSRTTARFEEVAALRGIDDSHASEGSPLYHLFGGDDESAVRQPSGVAVADVDGDGCEDLLLADSPDLALYRNRCDGRFEEVATAAGIPRPYPAAASGVVFFDYDNDGWPDLYVAASAGGDRLFRNLGRGRFRDVTSAAGIPQTVWSSMPVVADYDRDGFLDVYVAHMGDHGEGSPQPSYDARNGTPGVLLRNRGDGRFEDATRRAGVGSTGWDMAAAWGDYDGDGWPDLYVANEFGGNRLYRNEGDGTFSDRTRQSGTADGGAGMGVAWGDYDGDGDLDLFVSNMHSNSGWALFHPDFPTPIPWYLRLLGLVSDEVERRSDLYVDALTRGSTLLRNEGDGRFRDVSDELGVRDGQWGWGAQFLDYDNDGRLDLYAVNGFVSGPLLDDV